MTIQEHSTVTEIFGGTGMLLGLAHSRTTREIVALSNIHRVRPDTDFDGKAPFAERARLSSHTVPGNVLWGASNSEVTVFRTPPQTVAADSAVSEGYSGLVIDLERRLGNVNRHFRRKAAAVFNDNDALTLLATLYESVVVETEEFDFCQHGRALAKLTAANFAEVGANGIFITESGQRFIDNINAQ